ncbi:MAG: PrsW family intramembrane metalloprotease [Bacteroidales bacterium]|nr:PrsW family intramembrane metalloprotease [Bacteroidales bacterium]
MVSLIISILPNALYLLVLKALDSFALARFKLIVRNMLFGLLWCALAFVLTNPACMGLPVSIGGVSMMPLIEEVMKGAILAYLIARHKFRFMAQCLIYGAAIGSGFSLLENIIYFYFNPSMAVGTSIVRGFGCAILHMGCTALFATILLLVYKKFSNPFGIVISIVPSVTIHFLHNTVLEKELISPMTALVLIIVIFIVLFILLFSYGEKKIYEWMDHSIGNDIRTRSAIISGNFSSTKSGEYLLGVKEQFPPEVFFDMICYMQLFLELRIDKQSDMLLRQAGFGKDEADTKHEERNAKKAELAALSRQIGRTGMRVLAPLIKDGEI